jgi:hypothetical protein
MGCEDCGRDIVLVAAACGEANVNGMFSGWGRIRQRSSDSNVNERIETTAGTNGCSCCILCVMD